MTHAIALLGALGLAWWLWSGHTDPLLLGLGAASCVGVVLLSLRLRIVDRESMPIHLFGRSLFYVPWLVWEVVKANLHVARVVLSPTLAIRPRLIRVEGSQKTELGHAIYANSITLTPGTVALDVRSGRILVHALDEFSEKGLLTGDMDQRVTRLEGEG